jgi:hypothetical protein
MMRLDQVFVEGMLSLVVLRIRFVHSVTSLWNCVVYSLQSLNVMVI